MKAEVEKGNLPHGRLARPLRKDQSDLFGSRKRGATAFRVQGGPWGGGSSGFSRVSEASGVSVRDLGWVMDSRVMSPTRRSSRESSAMVSAGEPEFPQHSEEVRVDEAQSDPMYQPPASQESVQAASSDARPAMERGTSGQDLLDALGLEGMRSSQHPPGPSLPLRALTPASGPVLGDSPQTQPSWASLERGRVSVRSRRGRDPSTEDGRFNRLTSLLEHMMVRMDRLEDDRSSRRSSQAEQQRVAWSPSEQGLRPAQWGGSPSEQGLRPAQWGGYGVGFVGLDLGPESLNPSPRVPMYPSEGPAELQRVPSLLGAGPFTGQLNSTASGQVQAAQYPSQFPPYGPGSAQVQAAQYPSQFPPYGPGSGQVQTAQYLSQFPPYGSGSGQVQTTQYPQQFPPFGPGLGPTPTTQGPPQPALPSTGQDQLQVMQCQQQLADCHLEPNQGQRSLQSNVFQSLPRVDSTSLALEHGGLKSDLPESRRSMEADAGSLVRLQHLGVTSRAVQALVVVLTKDLGIRNTSLLVMLQIRFARLRLRPQGEVGHNRP